MRPRRPRASGSSCATSTRELAALVGRRQRAQPRRVASDDEVVDGDPAHAGLRPAGVLCERDGADVAAAVAQRAERRHRRRAADDVEDGVHGLADVERRAVDDLRDAVVPCAVGVLGAHGADDLGTGRSGQADGERADAAERAVDQHALAGLRPQRLHGLQRRQPAQRQRCRGTGRGALRPRAEVLHVEHDMFGIRSAIRLRLIADRDDAVAGRPRRHAGTDRLDLAGGVPADHQREALALGRPQVRRAAAGQQVDRVQRRGVDAQQHFARAGRRQLELGRLQHLGAAEAVQDDRARAHAVSWQAAAWRAARTAGTCARRRGTR